MKKYSYGNIKRDQVWAFVKDLINYQQLEYHQDNLQIQLDQDDSRGYYLTVCSTLEDLNSILINSLYPVKFNRNSSDYSHLSVELLQEYLIKYFPALDMIKNLSLNENKGLKANNCRFELILGFVQLNKLNEYKKKFDEAWQKTKIALQVFNHQKSVDQLEQNATTNRPNIRISSPLLLNEPIPEEDILELIETHLKQISNDSLLIITDVNEGSIKLTVQACIQGIEHLAELFKTGELTEIMGIPVEGAEIVSGADTPQLILTIANYIDLHVFCNLQVQIQKFILIKQILMGGAHGSCLRGANLIEADLKGAVLIEADLREADLTVADLAEADLSKANLAGANLNWARLKQTNLEKACLKQTNLRGAYLQRANLKGACLQRANLSWANLEGANLEGANLEGANLSGVNLSRTKIDKATQIDNSWRLVWRIVNQGAPGKDLSRFNFIWVDLRGADLREINLTKANLRGANLERANLEGANLTEANLERTNLRGANLSGVNFCRTKIDKTTQIDNPWRLVWRIVNQGAPGKDLSGVDLRGANLRWAYLEGANLEGANLRGANLEGVNLRGANLRRVDLEGANLEDAKLEQTNLEKAHIDETTQIDDKWRLVWRIVNQGAYEEDLSRVDLSRANLNWANLSGANLTEADLSDANLNWANLSDANLSGANLGGANLSGANLRGAQINETIQIEDKWRLVWRIVNQGASKQVLSSIDLSRANLSGADLSGADLSGADLSGADLSGADLSGADLSEADLSEADLTGTNLRRSNLKRARLKGAKVSRTLFGNNKGISLSMEKDLITGGATNITFDPFT